MQRDPLTFGPSADEWLLVIPSRSYPPKESEMAATVTVERVLTRCCDVQLPDGTVARFWRRKSGWHSGDHGWLYRHPLCGTSEVREAFGWKPTDYWAPEIGGVDGPAGWSMLLAGERAVTNRVKKGPHVEVWGERRGYPKRIGYLAPTAAIERARADVMAAKMRSKAGKSKGGRTVAQVAALSGLDEQGLLDTAAEAMVALNRRAKHLRGLGGDKAHQMRRIYALKDRFLESLVAAGMADAVYTWTLVRHGNRWQCDTCLHEWYGNEDQCFRCDGWGEQVQQKERWYLIKYGSRSWHTPQNSEVLRAAAAPHPDGGHDPTQPARDIPQVGLTIEAQHRCVEMAIERLSAMRVTSVIPCAAG